MTATIRALKPLEDTPAARLQRLRLEARAIAAADMEALIADLGAMAGRCAEVAASDAYPVGAREECRRLAGELPARLLRLTAIGGRG